MPEGDTLHRTAERLRPALVGGALERFEAPRLLGDRPALGVTIDRVEAVGKHLLIGFDDGLALRTHLGMPGSWHLYPTGARWRKPRHLLRALVAVPGWEAVCFSAPQVQTYRPDHPGGPLGTARDPLGHLGPDLCTPEVDLDEAVGRFATHADPRTTVAEVLLDQTVASGIGNVYKSELLHRCRVDPFVAVGEVPVEVRRELVTAANRLLLHNLTTTRRTTVAGPEGSVAVYGKARRPCPRCGTPHPHASPRRPEPQHLLVPPLPTPRRHRAGIRPGLRGRRARRSGLGIARGDVQDPTQFGVWGVVGWESHAVAGRTQPGSRWVARSCSVREVGLLDGRGRDGPRGGARPRTRCDRRVWRES